MFPIIGVLRSFPSVSQLCTHRGLVYPSCHHPKKKRPTASSKSFADFPRSIPRLSRGASMFSPQNHQSCGSCGSSPRVRLMVTVISRDHSGDLLPDATGTTRHRCFRDRYLHGKFPGWGYFRRPKVDACSCDSKFFLLKGPRLQKKMTNSIFIGRLFLGYSIHQVYKQNSIHVSFVGSAKSGWNSYNFSGSMHAGFCRKCLTQHRRYKDLDLLSRCKKKNDTKTPNLEYMT